MSMNTILIVLLIFVLLFGAFWYLKKTDMSEETEEYNNFLTIQGLVDVCKKTFSTTLTRSVTEMNLSQEEYNKISAAKEELKSALRTAPYGDNSAKQFVYSFIKDILQNQKIGGINAYNIDKVIPFDSPDLIKSREKTEILIFLWLREGKNGFTKNFMEYELDKPTKTPYGNQYIVTAEDIERVYDDYMTKRGGITYQEKIDYLTQRVYESGYGLGPVDLLLETEIDEVQAGTSGIPANSYDVEVENMEDISYSYESIWIVFHGLNIHLACTTFGTQDELVRVCRNIYRYNAPTILTKHDPGIISSMKNGNRITVACPDFSDSYFFIARKFDSTPSLEPERLL